MISPEREKTELLGDAQTTEGSQVFAPHALFLPHTPCFCPTRPVFAPHALKGQKLLAQGSALGIMANSNAPCKGKSFKYCQEF